MRINNNIPALNTHRMLGITNNSLEKTLERLSSGKRINKASDDAAGLAISQKMEAQVRGLRQASRNSLDGISLLQTAEGALNEVHAMLQRMRELAVQGANGIYEEDDLKAIANELKELTEQIDKIGKETTFNGIYLLKGELGTKQVGGSGGTSGTTEPITELRLQIGANEDQYIDIDMSSINVTVTDEVGSGAKGLKITNEIIKATKSGDNIIGFEVNSGLDSEKFSNAISIYDDAVKRVASHRSQLGAYQNRLEHTIRNVDNTAENLTAAKSRIEDADMALEMSEFVKLNILQQAGVAMLSQANQLPQTMLQLLQ
ncbi:flagellin N-terminal helical domain-containing protein [Clostridium sp. Cult1]|uniref:flagellin N-terminal helical domain-containing protein n=1 Tax=Clostridium sp. Cult1 TaxID=2079002 RepID=UPI001F2352D1|nr:flagellin [Clostridium sp. Cult1]MCF6463106.1 flagellin [Clostridium sp. Cult1]